ncbi:MAG: hypothetical protein ACE37M_02210 [Henriciella sp.]
MDRIIALLAVLIGQSILTACVAPRGAATVSPSGYAYNEAIAQTKSEQLLLNLVRLKYRDAIVFMDIDGVTTQHQYGATLSAEAFLPFQNATRGTGLLVPGIGTSETPTIVYKPLDGSQFAQDMLAPITPETIVLLANSGWSIERLMACCMERLGQLSNAPSASGPTPDTIPNNARFREATRLMRDLQRTEKVHVERLPGSEDEPVETVLHINAIDTPACARLQTLLGSRDCEMRYQLVAKGGGLDQEELFAQTRTVLGARYALSHVVEVPSAHKSGGLTTASRVTSPETPDWLSFTSELFRVDSGIAPPADAAVKVFYRDHWFWISDDDLESKTTFNLLLFLLALQSAASDGASPLLTIDAGG